MVNATIKRRLAVLEAKKARVEGTRWVLNFAGRDADAVVDDLGRRWERLPGEDYAEFEARATAGRPFGFITLNRAATA